MRTQTEILREISNETLNNLTYQVKETLALNYKSQKQLSAADLWNIQRRSRTLSSRRRFA